MAWIKSILVALVVVGIILGLAYATEHWPIIEPILFTAYLLFVIMLALRLTIFND